MKIAIWHNLPAGGAKRTLYNHVKELKERGHYLEAWTTDLSSENYLPLSPLIKEHRKPVSAKLNKINTTDSPIKKALKTSGVLKKHCDECMNEIVKGNFDLIFANSCRITYMPFIGQFSKIPAVLYLGEPNRMLYEAIPSGNVWEMPQYPHSLREIYRYYKDFLRTYSRRLQLSEEIKAAETYSKILVNSLFSRESLKRAYGVDSTVCYLGVDENFFNINEKKEKQPFVTGMGRISPAKNIELAISVISKIPKQNRPVLKWISNGYVPDYLDKITKIARKEDVTFIPLIDLPDSDLIELLNEASVMICTSHLEPFGLAPLEANMSGTFVVAIAEGGLRESIQDGLNGFLVNGTLPDEMAKLIIPFCSDTDYARQMGLQARKHAIKFWNREQMADNIERELESVLK